MTRSLLGGLLLAAVLGAGSHWLPAQTGRGHRILFVGNSLTAANGLPGMVESFANARGHAVEIMTVAVNNFSLEDHWNHGQVQNAIAKGHWTSVVLQQGPSSLPESRTLLRENVKRFATEVSKAGARTAVFMVWPAKSRERDFDAVSESYRLAAKDVDGVLLPTGDAWLAAWRLDASLQLYSEDGFHPSRLGSYLAALTIWRGLSSESVISRRESTTLMAKQFVFSRKRQNSSSSVPVAHWNSSALDDRAAGGILRRPQHDPRSFG